MQIAGTAIRAVFQPFHSVRPEAAPTGELLTRADSPIPVQVFIGDLSVDEQLELLTWQLGMQESLRAAGNWTASINVNNHLLESDQQRDHFLSLVSRFEGPVIFEFTETYPMPPVTTSNRLLRELRDMGHKSALDDFGTGLNGISLLMDYDFDIVKIDRSLVRDVARRPQQQRTLRWVHETLHMMGKEHVVEGIENQETFELLADLGFNDFQGYHFHEPTDVAAFGVTQQRSTP